MNLGPKKRERLVAQALGAYRAAYGWSECDMLSWRKGISAVVDLLLSRQAEQVAPLLEALRYCVNRMSDHGIHGAAEWGERALAAYEASQADEPEPHYKAEQRHCTPNRWWVGPSDPSAPGVWCSGATEEEARAIADTLNALAREKGGKP